VKIKLDENIGSRGSGFLAEQGHDVETVYSEGLSGSADEIIFHVCATEGRVLITLDRDFGEVLRFPPEESAGIVILDLGPRASPQRMLDRLRDFVAVAAQNDVHGSLWIVEPGRVRIHLRNNPKSGG
jgi:predicted nuclease of predicted toxin-antitoxin system